MFCYAAKGEPHIYVFLINFVNLLFFFDKKKQTTSIKLLIRLATTNSIRVTYTSKTFLKASGSGTTFFIE